MCGVTILAVAASLFFARFVLDRAANRLGVVAVRRNFYGVLRVIDSGSERRLVHAATMHGTQYRDYARRNEKTTYYTEDSGVGIAIRGCEARSGAGLRVGAVGLGAGTLAAYGRPGDYYCFYEINPEDVKLASGQAALFGFVGESGAGTEVKLGDGRLLLEKEPSESFDVLVLDAFSGGSTPMHLLTLEAFETYMRCLRPGGVLVMHVTNKYLDLTPVIWKAAGALGLSCVDIYSKAVESRASSADWMLLSRDAGLIEQLAGQNPAATKKAPGSFALRHAWTDDLSSVLRLVRLHPRDDVNPRKRGVR
jgi:SAM-dependent methyltransferase